VKSVTRAAKKNPTRSTKEARTHTLHTNLTHVMKTLGTVNEVKLTALDLKHRAAPAPRESVKVGPTNIIK